MTLLLPVIDCFAVLGSLKKCSKAGVHGFVDFAVAKMLIQ